MSETSQVQVIKGFYVGLSTGFSSVIPFKCSHIALEFPEGYPTVSASAEAIPGSLLCDSPAQENLTFKSPT